MNSRSSSRKINKLFLGLATFFRVFSFHDGIFNLISFWQIAGTHLASECDGGFKTKIDDEKCRAHKELARGRGGGKGTEQGTP